MNEKYIQDIKEIKDMMNRSARFISLSGLSGVSTGLIATLGAYFAYKTIFEEQDYLVYNAVDLSLDQIGYLLLLAVTTLGLSLAAAIYFTSRQTKKQNQNKWDHQTKRLLFNLAIPLIAGGLLCLMLLLKGFVGMVLPLTLIFYGLALVNGSKYTHHEIRNLGLIEIVLGLLAFYFISYALHFWTLGFGIIQMVYGLVIQKKYTS